MSSSFYYALQGANGYYYFTFKRRKYLMYATPYTMTKLDFNGLSDYQADRLEIDLEVIRDIDLYISSGRKAGSEKILFSLKDLTDLELADY